MCHYWLVCVISQSDLKKQLHWNQHKNAILMVYKNMHITKIKNKK
jgi:hypothetical protein